MTQYNFADLSFPGASQDFATGINDLGQVVGYYFGGASIGFLYSAGAYTAISYPAQTYLVPPGTIATPTNPGILIADHAEITQPDAINDSGQIVGWWELGTGIAAFVFSGGTYTGFLVTSTGPFGINNAGQIVVEDLVFSGGTRTTLPNFPAKGFASDINNVGQIVGYYLDSSTPAHAHGFIYENGAYTTLDDPLAAGTSTTGEFVGSFITGENDNGQIVGYYTDASGKNHGFLYDGGTFTTIDNPSGTGGTQLNGINNSGEIVGSYTDSAGNSHGFVATTGTISYTPLAYSPDAASTIVYANEYGKTPDPTETFKLIAFTTPQYAYGQQIGVIDPAIYAYESLGATLASGASHFQNTYGPTVISSDSAFVTNAYTDVFGQPGTPAQVQHFVDQLSFLESIYTASGSFGSPTNVDLIARGAVYGQMLGAEAEMTQVPIVGISAHV
jgi:probable HAF family extracellular repeat protein